MKKRLFTMLMAGMMLVAAVGCGGSSDSSNKYSMTEAAAETPAAAYDTAASADYMAEEEIAYGDAGEIASENGIESPVSDGRKLIKTVHIEMQTREFDSVLDSLGKKVQELGGYIENSSHYGRSYDYESTRSADYTVRIPADKLDAFVASAGEMGNVTYKSESVEDVTLQYVDTESRKKALETEQERLLELLGQAENMEDLLAIESKLSEVRYQLENYGSQLRVLDNQIDYSMVTINIQEVERITEARDRTFFEEVSDRFSDSLYRVGRGLRSFAVGFLGSLPVLAVWAVVIAMFIAVLRLVLRKRPKKEKKKLKLPFKKTPSDEEKSEP